jgi:antitoxin MazE
MNLHIARWGNSLALRIPAEVVRSIGIKEGDNVEASLTADGGLTIRPAKWDRKTFAHEVAEIRDTMPLGTSVIEELRRGARY